MPYRITFTRYNKNTARRQLSDVTFFNPPGWASDAQRFRAACDHAETLMEGMACVDDDWVYEIVSVAYDGFSGQQCCSMHGGIWGTPPVAGED